MVYNLFLYDVTGNQLLTSKGSFYSWNKDIYQKLLSSEYKHIKDQLMNSLVVHVDESPIKSMVNSIICIIFLMDYILFNM